MTKVFSEQYGCSAALSDKEIMLGLLKQAGFEIAKSVKDSDLNLIVTCIVKSQTEQRMIHRIKELTKSGKPLIVAGCMTKVKKEAIEKLNPYASLVGPDSVEEIVDVARATIEGKKVVALEDLKRPKLGLPKCRENPVIGITQVGRGCLLDCSFCVEPYRGKLFSYSIKTIVEDVKQAIKDGCKEIWISSLDNGCYGFDINTNLAELLNEISKIEEKFFVRVGMANPLHVRKILDDLIKAYKQEKIFKFLHLPVQSASLKILKLMKRGYEPEDVTEIVNSFYKAIPNLTLSTDIIVGFPGEEESDFEITVKFLEKTKPDVVNISRFGAHASVKLKQLPADIVNKRSRDLYDLVKRISLEKNQKWLNWEGECLIDEKSTNGIWVTRNFAYKPIVIKSSKNLLGKFLRVKVTDVKSNYLIGSI